MIRFTICAIVVLLAASSCIVAQDEALPSVEEVEAAIVRAATAFSDLSYQGGYPFLLSGDLQTRYNCGHGTLRAFPDETYLCIEPPGTPWVGRAFLHAYRATGDERLLEMAMEVGDALATVQLDVGGWRMRQPLTDEWSGVRIPDEVTGAYERGAFADLDDNRSQGPTLFLVELVRDGSTSETHRAAMEKGLQMLLEAQYPSGGWPQHYPPPEDQNNYRRYHTINDSTIPDCMRTLLAAYRAFGDQEYLDAVIRGADWLLEVRLPGAVWAQQYYDDFVKGPLIPNHPAPARWFEPMALTAGETGSVVSVLTEVWLETGDDRYIEPFEEVVEWYENSRLEDGRWARFYELHTNRPLYCTPDRIITHSDEDLRPGYAWKGGWGDTVIRNVRRVQELGRDGMLAERERTPDEAAVERLGRAAAAAVAALDDRGLWITDRGPEEENIRSDQFSRNLRTLADYVSAAGALEE